MPTIIVLDSSLSMQRQIPGRSDDNPLTFHQLAQKGITHFLDYVTTNSKLEYVSLVSYSSTCELKVDFTRDYDLIRQAAKKLEPGDKACFVSMLKCVATIIASNWASQKCQVIIFTDCGIGFGNTCLKTFINNFGNKNTDVFEEPDIPWLNPLKKVKINLVCMGLQSDKYFLTGIGIYQTIFEVTKINVKFFFPRSSSREYAESLDSVITSMPVQKSELGKTAMVEVMDRLCEINYKPFETILKCGGYFRLESHVHIWPPPQPYLTSYGERYVLASRIEVCGFLSVADIGSPVSLSRHLVLAKPEKEKANRRNSEKHNKANSNSMKYIFDMLFPYNEYERLELDIKEFYTKDVKYNDEQFDSDNRSSNNSPPAEAPKDTLCVLLHGTLKAENLAALVLLNEDWYGFIYSYSDSKKKANLMLNILPPGNNVVPWLGDFRMFGFDKDLMPGEVAQFPVKAEKKSYSQSCVVWIRPASLQSDVQKVLRHAKKIPEKIQHFYKELNRIRRAALAIGFVSLLDALANLFEKESASLSTLSSTNPEIVIQLQHAAIELRKPMSRDAKISLGPPTFPAISTIPPI